MFRPYFGICICHGLKRLIVVKAGLCKQGNSDVKHKNRELSVSFPKRAIQKTIKKTPIAKKVKKATGEAALFMEIWQEAIEEASPSCPTCRVCKAPLGYEPKTYYFSHVLAKSTYPSLRTYKPNIWLECFDCHREWDQGDRSLPKFAEKRAEALRLKQLYYAKQIP